jgi:hypothetical protein
MSAPEQPTSTSTLYCTVLALVDLGLLSRHPWAKVLKLKPHIHMHTGTGIVWIPAFLVEYEFEKSENVRRSIEIGKLFLASRPTPTGTGDGIALKLSIFLEDFLVE